jgi:predicted alpha/beta superfamily hydrolase
MRRPWLLAAAFALLVLGVAAYKVIGPRSHVLTPPRATNGVDYVLYVHVPDACRTGGCRALYLLDGLAWLPRFAELDDELSRNQDIAPLILVGIGYRNAVATADLRKHDFTPAFGRAPGRTGGADAFLEVLQNEIIPYAETHLPIAAGERGLAGHSYAGLFTAYALAKAPDLFDSYMIMSPALWFDGGKIYGVPVSSADRVRSVFLAADTPRGQARSAMANDTLRLNDLLAAQSSLRVSHALIVGESHNGMVAPAARRGLIALYGAQAAP